MQWQMCLRDGNHDTNLFHPGNAVNQDRVSLQSYDSNGLFPRLFNNSGTEDELILDPASC